MCIIYVYNIRHALTSQRANSIECEQERLMRAPVLLIKMRREKSRKFGTNLGNRMCFVDGICRQVLASLRSIYNFKQRCIDTHLANI